MRELILASLFALLVIVVVEVGFRATGGVPSSPQGRTPVEFQWRVREAGQSRERRTVYVVGDSRVEWGFAESVFNDSLRARGRDDLLGVNAGVPAASAAKVARNVLDTHRGSPGVLAICFTPCSFYQFEQCPGPAADDLKLQDLLDDRIDTFMRQWVWTWGRRPSALAEHASRVLAGKPTRDVIWYDREYTPDGCLTLKGRYNDDEQFDLRGWTLQQYQRMFAGLRRQSDCDKRLAEVRAVVDEARKSGWTVVLLRLPVSESMRRMESELPPELGLEAASARLGLPTIDYQADPRMTDVQTVDESHLAPASARKIASLLAEDIAGMVPR